MQARSRSTGERDMRTRNRIIAAGRNATALLVAAALVAGAMLISAAPARAQSAPVDETESAQKTGRIMQAEESKGTARGIQLQIRQTGYGTSYGKNKVTYDNFDFWVYNAPHFDIYYYQEEEAHLDEVVAFSESAYQRLRRLLNHDLSQRTPIVFYQTHAEFEQTHIFPLFLPEGVAAFAEPTVNRLVEANVLGERAGDLSRHPLVEASLRAVAATYDGAHDEEVGDLFRAESPLP